MNLDRSIGDIFVEEGYVSRDELEDILRSRTDTTEPLGSLLVRLGKVTEKQKLKCLGLQMGIPFLDLARMDLDSHVARRIPHAVALRLLSIPIELTEVAATIAMVNPLDLSAIDELTAALQVDVDPVLCTEEDVRDAIYRSYGAYDDLGEIIGEAIRGVESEGVKISGAGAEDEDEDDKVNVIELKEVVEGAPVVKLANALMTRAITMRASDIHIEPFQRRVRVRFRVDGLLQEVMSVPKDLQYALASRIKIIAGLDIAERRMPQDGRFTLIASGASFDFRVSTYPCSYGENVVIRILDKSAALLDINKLGIADTALKTFVRRIEEPQGCVLVSGPTGSGKTTTLYAGVNHLNAIHRNIITIEDPVEYQIDGTVQGNVNPKAGVTFATGLRSILRQDPDVILVGEIRDAETASIAVEASLTGHLVLSSIHANDSAASLTRLADMGVEPFLMASSVTCSVAQRLVRMVCPKCREKYKPSPEAIARLGLPMDATYARGRGCEACSKTGFRGRLGIYEVMDMTPPIRKLLLSGAHATEVRELATKEGMQTLREDAANKILEGLTTIEEVIRGTAEA
ncbi:MAG: Flp pilus assembly complex ATPase component TadA [Armatimonadetes bacterium]|nr:Flp pilus assembly complex ATPase component TadA [Armatimonadota bacterium]